MIIITIFLNSIYMHNNNPVCKTEKETQIDFWTLWEKEKVG